MSRATLSPPPLSTTTGAPRLADILERGLLLAVGLANQSKSFAKTVLVRVMHVTPQPGGTYLVGGTFETPLTYDELRAMVM